MKQAAITLLSGPVGAGKSTLADQLQEFEAQIRPEARIVEDLL